ncbi:MAG: hybrid sensor histidine kinase/response regulator [Bacteroidota bacterium]
MDDTSPQGKQQFNIPSSARSLLKDEFADTFNTLQEHCAFLDERIDTLSSKLVSLEKVLAEERGVRTSLEQALAAEKVKTRAAEEVRSQFLDNMSHELRTPLNGILGMTQLLLDMPINFEIKDCAQSIHESGQLLEHVISHLLDYSRLLQGDFPLQSDTFHLLEQIEAVVQQHAITAFQKGLDLELQLEKELLCVIQADQHRFRQVITLVLQNALKFTASGQVQVAACIQGVDDEAMYHLRITDTGIGIEEHLLPLVYEPFWQAERSYARTYGGLGLGLSLCQQLVHHMGGSISMTSQPAAGTSVTVKLPINILETLDVNPTSETASLGSIGLYNLQNGHGESIANYLKWLNLVPLWLDPAEFDTDTAASCGLIIHPYQGDNRASEDPLCQFYNQSHTAPPPLRMGVLAHKQEIPRKEKKAFDLFIQQPVLFTQLQETLAYAGTLQTRQSTAAYDAPALTGTTEVQSILLIEPNKINQKILSYMLQSLDMHVDVLESLDPSQIPEGHDSYRAVLINTMISPTPSIELLHELSQQSKLQGISCIIGIRGKNAGADPATFLQAGISRFLTLPTSIDAVRTLIMGD